MFAPIWSHEVSYKVIVRQPMKSECDYTLNITNIIDNIRSYFLFVEMSFTKLQPASQCYFDTGLRSGQRQEVKVSVGQLYRFSHKPLGRLPYNQARLLVCGTAVHRTFPKTPLCPCTHLHRASGTCRSTRQYVNTKRVSAVWMSHCIALITEFTLCGLPMHISDKLL